MDKIWNRNFDLWGESNSGYEQSLVDDNLASYAGLAGLVSRVEEFRHLVSISFLYLHFSLAFMPKDLN